MPDEVTAGVLRSGGMNAAAFPVGTCFAVIAMS